MWITYLFLSCKLVTSFSTFSIFILSGENGKYLWSSWHFPGYWTHFLHLILEVSSIYSKLFTGSFCDISQPKKLFTSQYLRYDDSLFLS